MMEHGAVLSPQERLTRLAKGEPLALGRYDVVRSSFRGRPVQFAVRDPEDVIQRHHMAGRFYEMPELRLIRSACPPRANFFDFGANVGNHTVFAALFLRAARVVAVEPNPVAYDTLIANVALNGVAAQVDGRWLGYGISDRPRAGFDLQVSPKNLGAGRLVSGATADAEAGPFAVVSGDTVVGETRADFIKLDIEGMELAALDGLRRTIARDRPPIFIEVHDASRDGFFDWMAANGYHVVNTYRRYKLCENFLISGQDPQITGAKDA